METSPLVNSEGEAHATLEQHVAGVEVFLCPSVQLPTPEPLHVVRIAHNEPRIRVRQIRPHNN